MRTVSLFIKPVSGACNISCRYCFYCDIVQKREFLLREKMTEDALDTIVKKVFDVTPKNIQFAFQGGEPTLAGLDFFKTLVRLVRKYNAKGASVSYSIQTNGIVIDEGWAEFLAQNGFLVGLSIDGTKEIHNQNRIDRRGEGTHAKVMNAARLMSRYKVEYNAVTVITPGIVKHIDSIYAFYKKNGIDYMQFIPCLDPLYAPRGEHQYSLTPQMYERFLKRLFDLWFHELMSGGYTYIRTFESLLFLMKGLPSPSCGMNGKCVNQMVIEADGGVYPCDFYVLDEYKIGNILEDELTDLIEKGNHCEFIKQSLVQDRECDLCEWNRLCNGGCRRDRQTEHGLGQHYYCDTFKRFFEYAGDRLQMLADRVNI